MSALVLAVLSGCSTGVPSAKSLEGTWLNTTDGIHRGMVVERGEREADVDQAYTLYLYEDGDAPEPVQSGLLSVIGDDLVYDVRWDIEPFNIGIRFANPLERLSRKQIRIGERIYDAVDALPGGSTEIPRFGDAIDAVEIQGVSSGMTALDDGSVWTASGDIFGSRMFGLTGSGGLEGPLLSEDRAFTSVVSDGGELGWTDGFATLGRYSFVETPPPDAFSNATWTPEEVWTRGLGCFRLVETPEHWVGMCVPDAELSADVGGAPWALVWLDPSDGSTVQALPFDATPLGVWSLGEDVLVSRYGASATPEIHGARGADGYVLERFDGDARIVGSWWFPANPIVYRATSLADGTTVVSSQTVDAFPGAGLPGFEQVGALLALGPEGVRWQVDLPDTIDPYYANLHGTGTGFVLPVGASGEDFGGSVGTVGPASTAGKALAVLHYDACGEPLETALFEDCSAECWGRTTPVPDVTVTGVVTDARGDLVLHANLIGRYRFGRDEVGTGDGGAALVRLAAPEPAPACTIDATAPVQPVVHVTVTGSGSVDLGDRTCTGDCTFPFERFEEIQVSAAPAAGWQVDVVAGACTSLPCTVYADMPVIELEVDLVEPDAMLLGSTGHVDLMAGGQTQVFAVGAIQPTTTAELDGTVLGSAPNGDGGFLAVLDTNGLVSHTVLPVEFGGPVFTDLAAIPGEDAALVLLQSGAVHRFDATGITETGSVGSGNWRLLAVDGLGNAAVAGTSFNDLQIRAVDGSWSHTFPTGTTALALDVVGLDAGGFAFFGLLNGTITVGPDVITGAPGDLALIRIGADGSLLGTVAVGYQGALDPTFRAWEQYGDLWISTTVPRSPTPPPGQLFAERLDATGAYTEVLGFEVVEGPILPYSGGTVALGELYGPTNPFGGAPLSHRGGIDLLVSWNGPTGTHLQESAMGGPLDDNGYQFRVPFAVLPDGTVFAETSADAVVSTPYAVGILPPP
ncbi:MAG: hypothetical protein R3F61_14700 [Myxococcota bacterium]